MEGPRRAEGSGRAGAKPSEARFGPVARSGPVARFGPVARSGPGDSGVENKKVLERPARRCREATGAVKK